MSKATFLHNEINLAKTLRELDKIENMIDNSIIMGEISYKQFDELLMYLSEKRFSLQ